MYLEDGQYIGEDLLTHRQTVDDLHDADKDFVKNYKHYNNHITSQKQNRNCLSIYLIYFDLVPIYTKYNGI